MDQIFKMDHVVKIYIPGTIDANTPAPEIQDKCTKEAAVLFSSLFGGATFGKFTGSWIDDAGKLIEEPVNVVYSFLKESDVDKVYSDVLPFARRLRSEMNQYCISVEFDGRLGFVED